ncbi:34440_t:CDS:2, partial [Racocetra persica]
NPKLKQIKFERAKLARSAQIKANTTKNKTSITNTSTSTNTNARKAIAIINIINFDPSLSEYKSDSLSLTNSDNDYDFQKDNYFQEDDRDRANLYMINNKGISKRGFRNIASSI